MQQVKAVVVMAKNEPATVTTINVPDPGPVKYSFRSNPAIFSKNARISVVDFNDRKAFGLQQASKVSGGQIFSVINSSSFFWLKLMPSTV